MIHRKVPQDNMQNTYTRKSPEKRINYRNNYFDLDRYERKGDPYDNRTTFREPNREYETQRRMNLSYEF